MRKSMNITYKWTIFCCRCLITPKRSMYGIFTCTWGILRVNVDILYMEHLGRLLADADFFLPGESEDQPHPGSEEKGQTSPRDLWTRGGRLGLLGCLDQCRAGAWKIKQLEHTHTQRYIQTHTHTHTPLRYIIMHYIALHCITLHCITLHYITIHIYIYMYICI